MTFTPSPLRLAVALLALSTAPTPVAAGAQADSSGIPSYAQPSAPTAEEETIHGQIAAIDAPDRLQVHDDRGFIDDVQLDARTTVNPPGTRFLPGMIVSIAGVSRGSYFAARRIDLPRQAAGVGQPPPPPGTELTGVLGTALDSKSAYVGESVTLANVASSDGAIAGATLSGAVTNVVTAGQGRNAQIEIYFDTLQLRGGTVYPVDGVVAQMQVNTKSNTLKEVGGALAGMLAGNAIAKTVLGVSGGGIVGAVGGFLIAKDNRSDISVPADTTVTVRLVNPRRQPS
jgi:outer membrane lipoprotein SlyB